MKTIVVVDRPQDWPFSDIECTLVSASDYIKNELYMSDGYRVLNLCSSYSFQKRGYYVSLIATARGHRPSPSLTCIQDIKSPGLVRTGTQEMEEVIEKSLKHISSESFELNIYFGKTASKHYEKLAEFLYKLFPAPFFRVKFGFLKDRWTMTGVSCLSIAQVTEAHKEFAQEQISAFLNSKLQRYVKKRKTVFDLAILVNPDEEMPPSNKRAIKLFMKAAEEVGFAPELINKSDFGRVSEFDALFIRETTNVNHHTYRFARRAYANGLEVIDDPLSILLCCNKIYLHELMQRHRIPIPKSLVLDREKLEDLLPDLSFPLVLKQPSGAFSVGVRRADDREELRQISQEFFEKSDLILAQEYMPSDFDWRVGILAGRVIYACKYYMVKNHWQIYKHDVKGKAHEGGFETVPVELVPKDVIALAQKACSLIGNGLYGVDIKVSDGRGYIIEINDNPSIESGVEDTVRGYCLYLDIMEEIKRRVYKAKHRL